MADYGVIEREIEDGELSRNIEQLKTLGFTTLNSNFLDGFRDEVREICLETAEIYKKKFSKFDLEKIGEANIYRAPCLINSKFLQIADHPQLKLLVSQLISGKVYLNQQNLVINPPKSDNYSQLKFHRDLPYQHYTSSRPLAINALYAVDDFTIENGATYVLPATHKIEKFPSDSFAENNQIQVEVKAGTFLVLDCMLYHAAAPNNTNTPRIGINHVYSTVMFRPQIDISEEFESQGNYEHIHIKYGELLGYNFRSPRNVADFLAKRSEKID